MKLRVRFLQLPILFDAARLAEEVAAIPENAWRPHPMKFSGNDALPLITADGDPSNDSRGGAMRATPHLLACPYLMQVLSALGATWGRSRLMRLSGDAEVKPHVDIDYYWRDHLRVHVPIVTQPTVRFHCGDEQVNMAAGECWVFDTWSLHSVHNDATRARIHLVADTVGGAGFLTLMENGRSPGDARPGWSPTLVSPRPGPKPQLAYEGRNLPKVMTPWEIRDHLGFLLSDLAPEDARIGPIVQALNRFRVIWHALWAQAADDEGARPDYDGLLSQTLDQVVALGADEVKLTNGMSLGLCLRSLIFNTAIGASAAMDSDGRNGPQDQVRPGSPAGASPPPNLAATAKGEPWRSIATTTVRIQPPAQLAPVRPAQAWIASAPRKDPIFDRPIFIVSSPRSGSTLLFETLAGARDVFTIGQESHSLIEGLAELGPAAHGWSSNRLSPDDAAGGVAARLRERFAAALRDRNSRQPVNGPVVMLEKTPKNSLRIPFLTSVFPDARFVYLFRAPRSAIASMMEAWTSGRFKTYPQLPGWTGLPWSLLLTPGWQALSGAPLNTIVATQWATTTRILLDDLQQLPADRWTALSYESFIAAPQAVASALCSDLGLVWDRAVGSVLPPSRYVVSPPGEEKWRAKEGEIEAVAHLYSAQEQRALQLLGR